MWMVPCNLLPLAEQMSSVWPVFPLIHLPKQLKESTLLLPPLLPTTICSSFFTCPGVLSHLPSWKHPITLQQRCVRDGLRLAPGRLATLTGSQPGQSPVAADIHLPPDATGSHKSSTSPTPPPLSLPPTFDLLRAPKEAAR